MAFDREIGGVTICAEGSNQLFEAQIGIAYSLFNRLTDGRFGSTIAAICLKRYQYSEWNADVMDNANLERVANLQETDPAIINALAAYDAVANNSIADPTDGATHYYDTSISAPNWTVGATKTAQIGNLVFYKNVK